MKMKAPSLILAFTLMASLVNAQSTKNEILYFHYDKSELTATSQHTLDRLIQEITNEKVANIRITGHTDGDGSEHYNVGLSSRRNQAVLDFLLENGVEQNLIHTANFGEEKPIASNTALDEKYKNRRVEITVEYVTSISEAFTGTFQEVIVNPGRDTSIRLNKYGTTLHISANSFADDNNQPVLDQVTILYKEYRNAAEMAFCKIPMTYAASGINYLFNSSGMFEIYGQIKNKPVKMASGKTMKIDYALAKQNPDIAFFQLNNKGDNWDKIQEIAPLKKANDENVIFGEQFVKRVKVRRNVRFQKRWLIHIGDVKIIRLTDRRIIHSERDEAWEADASIPQNKQTGTLLAEGIDAGHTYPDIIKGLSVGNFGVYNCDQAYRIQNAVTIQAKYANEAGEEIQDGHVLSMMDLNYNGAFSNPPRGFRCDAKGKNALVLFTKDKQLYVLTPDEFAKMDIQSGSGSYTFAMKNMTNEIHNSEDLAMYLGIETE